MNCGNLPSPGPSQGCNYPPLFSPGPPGPHDLYYPHHPAFPFLAAAAGLPTPPSSLASLLFHHQGQQAGLHHSSPPERSCSPPRSYI